MFYWLFGNKKNVYVLVIRDLLGLKSLFFLIRKQIRSIFDLLANFDFRLTDPKLEKVCFIGYLVNKKCLCSCDTWSLVSEITVFLDKKTNKIHFWSLGKLWLSFDWPKNWWRRDTLGDKFLYWLVIRIECFLS